MFRFQDRVRIIYFCVDIVVLIFSFFIPYLLRYNYESLLHREFKNLVFPNLREYLFIFSLWGFLTVISLKRRQLYSTDRTVTIPKEIMLVLRSVLFSSMIVSFIIFFAKFKFFSRWVFLANFLLMIVFLTLWRVIKRLILRSLIEKGFHNFNILIVGTDRVARILFEEIKRRPFLGLNVVGVLDDSKKDSDLNLPLLGTLSDFKKICKKYFIDEVFITDSYQKEVISKITRIAKDMNIGIRLVPANFEEALFSINISYLGSVPLLTYKEREIHPAELAIKRVFDFFLSLILLFILSPLFLILSILIKIDSPGPVFYIQKRMGRKGRVFNFYKFRSMVKDADNIKAALLEKNESKGGVIFKMRRDPRVTRVGRFLRKFSLDELPQLINVLKGDMSLVGPRPFPVEESEKMHYDHLPRLNIRPGITGLAQVRGRSDLSFSQWVKWDLWYVNHWSFGLDLKILWWTIPAVLKGKGVY